MQTANYIQASAQVTSITTLKKGDVYKRLVDEEYGADKVVYGIVYDVLYNGSDAAVLTIEFTPGYRELKTELKTFAGKKEIKIFPATPDEIKKYTDDAIVGIEREIEVKTKEVEEAKAKLVEAKQIVNGELAKKLSTPEYSSEMPALEG